jgi:beta-phosphoglucomutase
MTAQPIGGIIFDLDGVLITTDELHYRSWRELADAEGIPFDRTINQRLRGVSRMRSLEIILERSSRPYTIEEKEALAARKNDRYRQLLEALTDDDLIPGAIVLLTELRHRGAAIALASSSRNARLILRHLGITDLFDAIVDGNDIRASKPDPDVFLQCAARLGVPAEACVVLEDAAAGVEAARRAGMAVIGIGAPADLTGAELVRAALADLTADDLLKTRRAEPH